MNNSGAVWTWVHQKYGMSQIVQELHSLEKNSFTLLLSTMLDYIDKK